ncbi:MAG: nuclear transport factor 2 family protein [bacterium]|nr:nuclear transport factor 2 family protein [bacterium]
MASDNDEFLAKWHALVTGRDLVALEKILAEDISMGAPPYWDKVLGRSVVHHLLGLIIHAIDDFTYHREWHDDSRGEGEIALEFRGHVGELNVQGLDLITLNSRGEVQNLDVMIRPMNALAALKDIIAPQMAEFLRANAQ